MSVPAICCIVWPAAFVHVASDVGLPLESRASRGASAGSHEVFHVAVLNAWEIQGREA